MVHRDLERLLSRRKQSQKEAEFWKSNMEPARIFLHQDRQLELLETEILRYQIDLDKIHRILYGNWEVMK